MSAHRHPKWLEEARRAEGGGVSEDDKQMSQHFSQQNAAQQGMGSNAMSNALKEYNTPMPKHYGDAINRANESGADPADVQDVMQGAMHRADGGSAGGEKSPASVFPKVPFGLESLKKTTE
jgi:hypothetical protein